MKFLVALLLSISSLAQPSCCKVIHGNPVKIVVPTTPAPAPPVPVSYANTIITYFGNSITHGYNVDSTHRWATILTDSLNAIQDNRGVPGMYMQANIKSMLNILPTVPIKTDSLSLLVISLGINDVYYNSPPTYTPAKFAIAYDSVLTYITVTKHWPVNRILLIAPNYINRGSQYDAPLQTFIGIVQTAATNWGTKYASPFPLFNGHTEWLADGVHPNNTGHIQLANFIYNILR